MLNPRRTIDDLKSLRELTSDTEGAQRVAFTDTWVKARKMYLQKLAELPVSVEQDEAGNLWATLLGESSEEIWIGSHLDSVPAGGWLDGCLGVLAGLEVLRNIAESGKKPPLTLRLVDWADEEGARFGRSLFGSSALSGHFDPAALGELTDAQGIRLKNAVKAHGIDLDLARSEVPKRKKAKAYLELHIEQGPVLESLGKPMGVVLGTKGVERHTIRFFGQTAHSGSTPMNHRRDALSAAARLTLAIKDIARKHPDAVGTVGRVTTRPGIVTAVVGECEMTLDQRDLDSTVLDAMLREAKDASEHFAKEENVRVEWEKLWSIEPIPFDDALIHLAEEAVTDVCGTSVCLPSGPLHDAAEVARAGIPTVMLFVQSLRGISHHASEDTQEAHLEAAVKVLDTLTAKALAWLSSTETNHA